MRARALAAALVAAMSIVVAPRVHAADLYGETYTPPAETDDYDEGPYAACDQDPCDEEAPLPESYSDYEDAPYGYEGSLKDGLPPPPRPRYGERRDHAERVCLPRSEIKRRLHSEGWTDLRPIDRDGPIVGVRARRSYSGRQFVLDVDRCTGDIVYARPAALRTFGAYERPRWGDGAPY